MNWWNHLTMQMVCLVFCVRQTCLATTLRLKTKPHVAWLEPRVLCIFLSIIALFCYLSKSPPCLWRSSEITLCDRLLQVLLFLQRNLVWILNRHTIAAIAVSIAHYGTKFLSSLREYRVFPEWRTCSDDRFHRCFPADTNINRYRVHLGTFIHVSLCRSAKIQVWRAVV